MKIIIILFIVIAVFLIPKITKAFVYPPHEFAYGTQLSDIRELPERVGQFLSLECLDPNKIRIEVSIMIKTSPPGFHKGGVNSLIKYLSKNLSKEPKIDFLLTSLEGVEKMGSPLQQSLKLINILIEYKDILRDEAKQDDVIVFIHYGLKNFALLDQETRDKISSLISTLDTEKQFRLFVNNNCPDNFLEGNINIYPLSLENTSWYRLAKINREDSSTSILEIRFMGLRGIFRYLLETMQSRHNITFFHLDGEKISSVERSTL